MFDDGRLKSASYDSTEGFGLRVVAGETAGYAHASEISEAAIGRAAESAALAKRGYSGVAAEGPRATNAKLYGEDDPLASPGFSDKVALLQEIDAFARARDPRVAQVMASLAGERRMVEILRADGRLIRDVRPLVRLNVSDHRREGRPARDRLLRRRRPRRLRGLDHAGQAGRTRSTRRCARPWSTSTPCPARPARWTWCWARAGTACCCTRRSATAWKATSTARAPRPSPAGSASGWPRPASPCSTTARSPGRRGSLTIDDEGTPTERTVLIEDGILVGYMHDRQSARLMGLTATGNGRRQSYAHMPMPRMTNTAMLGGDHTLRGDDRLDQARASICATLRRRPGGHHQRQVRVPVHRGLSDRGRQGHHAGQGRDPDRRRPLGPDPGDHDRRRLLASTPASASAARPARACRSASASRA